MEKQQQAAADDKEELLIDVTTAKETNATEEDGADSIEKEFSVNSSNAPPQYALIKSFADLPLTPELLQGVSQMGFDKVTKIQAIALSISLSNPAPNVVVQSHSGTGKTVALILTALNKVDPAIKSPQVLCITPVRELARMLFDLLKSVGQFSSVDSTLLMAGDSLPRKIDSQIVVSTPGKLLDAIRRRAFNSRGIKLIAIDEVDTLMDSQGLADQVRRIFMSCPAGCQKLMCTATYKDSLRHFIARDKTEPCVIQQISKAEFRSSHLAQFMVEHEDKVKALSEIVRHFTVMPIMVSVQSLDTAKIIEKNLQETGISVAVFSPELDFKARDLIFDDYRSGKTKVLITTLIRGLHTQNTLVVNYDLPVNSRTGEADYESFANRCGKQGVFSPQQIMIHLVSDEESKKICKQIEDHFSCEIKKLSLDELEKLDELYKQLC